MQTSHILCGACFSWREASRDRSCKKKKTSLVIHDFEVNCNLVLLVRQRIITEQKLLNEINNKIKILLLPAQPDVRKGPNVIVSWTRAVDEQKQCRSNVTINTLD